MKNLNLALKVFFVILEVALKVTIILIGFIGSAMLALAAADAIDEEERMYEEEY